MLSDLPGQVPRKASARLERSEDTGRQAAGASIKRGLWVAKSPTHHKDKKTRVELELQ